MTEETVGDDSVRASSHPIAASLSAMPDGGRPPEMTGPDPVVRFAYDPPALRVGRDTVDSLGEELAAQDCDRALVVCGSTVGDTPGVMDPVTAGLGDALAGVFDETTPAKRLSTAVDGRAALADANADVIVAVGGGSSLDVAKLVAILAGTDRKPTELGAALAETGTLPVPAAGLPDIVAVPTTLAGADCSQGAGVTATPEGGLVTAAASGGVSDPKLMPAAVIADPALLETTPDRVLAASAMNGFDKGLETLYSRRASPVTDATATRGLASYRQALLEFGDGDRERWVYDVLARASILVQYGISRPDGTTLSLIHAFGHGLTRSYSVQQGAAHAVVAPHVLQYLFETVDGRRAALARALGAPAADDHATADDHAAAVVEAVRTVRDALGLPTRLRDVEGPEPAEFETVARHILADSFMANRPADLEVTVGDIEAVLEAAW